ncbi:MAG: sulfite exporter TauE/SafE family protein [Alphaproteobacteria bacterium]|jgi:uncharacterized membrane protein YfcA
MADFVEILLSAASLWAWVWIAGAALLAGFLRGFVGFGGALVVVMTLSVVLGPLAAVPISFLSGLPSTIQLLPVAWRESERAFVVPFGLATFFGAPLGAWVLVSADPAIIKIAISVFVLIMVLMLHRDWRFGGATGAPYLAAAGAAAGFIQGVSGIGGPPAVVVALSRPGAAPRQRANVIGAVTALSFCAFPPLWYNDLFTRDVVVISVAVFPLYVAGTWVGSRYFSRQGQKHFRSAALLLLAGMGVTTLVLAIL